MSVWPYWRRGGATYFRRWGFSVNEGELPNVHMSWGGLVRGFYIALAPGLRLWWFKRKHVAGS